MTNLSIICQDEVSENQVIRSRVAKTQQPDAERLNAILHHIRNLEILKILQTKKNIFAILF